jgi:hypothetical protein
MIRRRQGITIGNPPGYVDYEDDLHKVVAISDQKEPTGALLYECVCKSCNGKHLRNATQLKRKRWARECPNYRPPNWSGLDPEDRILQRDYGITIDQFNELLEYQNGECAICSADITKERRGLNVDHCHTTGIVRGLLCPTCNMGLGQLGDNLASLEKAVAYLKSPPFQQSLARAR